MAHTAATPTKLKSGAWGARTVAGVKSGDVITITTRAGKSWDARVDKVVWSNGEIAIVATSSLDRPSKRRHEDGCSHCRPRPGRTAQIWEECDYCGCEPIYV